MDADSPSAAADAASGTAAGAAPGTAAGAASGTAAGAAPGTAAGAAPGTAAGAAPGTVDDGASRTAAGTAYRRPWHGWKGSASAILTWVGSRLGLIVFVLLTAFVAGVDPAVRDSDLGLWAAQRFAFWDSNHFVRIADLGYLPPGLPCCDQAFFPGYPLLVGAVAQLTGASTILAGLLVTLVAGVVAVAMLWRLARDTTGNPRVASCAALYLSIAPFGIFLTAVYTESTFLALALGAWWAGDQRRWWLAGILAGLASGVRVNGLFLAAGLVVMYAVQLRSESNRRPRWDVLALALPFAAVGAFVAYLQARTGSWNAWREAESVGWDREPAWPWDGLVHGWTAAQQQAAPHLVISRWADLLVVVGGLLAVGVLLWLRRWAEATYLGLSVGVVVCSTMLVSAPRYALMWFPAYLLVAQLAARPRWRWVNPALVLVCLPLMAIAAHSFALRLWIA